MTVKVKKGMVISMKVTYLGDGRYELNSDTRSIILDHSECYCIAEYFRHSEWRGNLEDAIDEDESQYDFDKISRDEFLDMCIEEMQRKYEECLLGEPDYADVVFSVAEENGIWKE